MLNDIAVYKNTKRNEICPCGSGKVFKKCCMNEYRKVKKSMSSAKVSSFTPIPPLTKEGKTLFTELYQSLLLFSFEHQNRSKEIESKIVGQESTSFLAQQRDYFYQNIDEVIDEYRQIHYLDEEKLDILKDLKNTKFDYFYLLSKTEESAVLMDQQEKLYNIQALHSPLSEVLDVPMKYFVIRTAVIPYKNRYISDGLFNVSDIPKDVESYLNTIPLKNLPIHYNKENKLLNIPIMLHFSLSCEIEKFEKMEQIVLKQLPHLFIQGLINQFENPYSYKVNLISSLLRSTDLSNELNSPKGDQTFSYIIGGTPVMNFEYGTKTDVISYDILEKLYMQKPIYESIGRDSYRRAQDRGLFQNFQFAYSSFYTMLGVVHIEERYLGDFDVFLRSFEKREKREVITREVENLFDELSQENGFEITPVFLGIGTDLNSIYEEIEQFRDYMKSEGSSDLAKCREYSVTKGK